MNRFNAGKVLDSAWIVQTLKHPPRASIFIKLVTRMRKPVRLVSVHSKEFEHQVLEAIADARAGVQRRQLYAWAGLLVAAGLVVGVAVAAVLGGW